MSSLQTTITQSSISTYFKWIEDGFEKIQRNAADGSLYIIDGGYGTTAKEMNTVLGVLEAMDLLSFEMNGGANSQLYIYVNQVRLLENIINNPGDYENRLLEMVSTRHLISVKMLTYLYEGNFTSDEIWNILEDYFLGVIPERVKANCQKENPKLVFN